MRRAFASNGGEAGASSAEGHWGAGSRVSLLELHWLDPPLNVDLKLGSLEPLTK